MPITEIQLAQLSTQVLWAAFGIACIMGWVMSWSNFCTMGAVSDIVNMGDWTRMRMWLAAIGIAILGTHLLASFGIIDLSKSIYTAPRLTWLSYILGGLMFGIGMVLASGCGSKTLVRIGGGSIKSLIVLLVVGITAYMCMRGIFAVVRVGSIDTVAANLPRGQDLGRLLSSDAASLPKVQLWLGLIVGLALIGFALLSREFRQAHSLIGSILIGSVIVAIWWVSGHLGHVAEHPKTLEESFLTTNSGRMESLSFVAPMAYTLEWLMLWSDASKVISLGIASILGMVFGSSVHALASKQFRWEGFHGTEDTANHLIGGTMMGVGGVLAMGCTIGQGLSGISTLAIGSIMTFLAIISGAYLGLRYQAWRVNQL